MSPTRIAADNVAMTVRGVITSLAVNPLKANSVFIARASSALITPSLRPMLAIIWKSSLDTAGASLLGAIQPVNIFAITTKGYIKN